MAQHDYVIDNSTGANVRADINGALSAISTNNSGSSEPSTTFASQFFADTSAGQLKLRNTSNNGYVSLFTLAGGVNVDAASNFNEDVTFKGATSGRNIVFNKSHNQLEFADSAKASFGSSQDLSIHHDGSNSIIEDSGTGNLNILSSKAQIMNPAQNEAMAKFIENAGVELLFDNAVKIETRAGDTLFHDDIVIQDNNKIKIGTGDDMLIFHDSLHSYVQDTGTGELRLASDSGIRITKGSTETCAFFDPDGKNELYFDNSVKLTTISSGVLVGKTSSDIDTNGIELLENGATSITRSGLAPFTLNRNTNNGTLLSCMRSGTEVGTIAVTTSNTSYNTTSSDRSLKKNFEDWTENTLNLFKNIKPQKFNFIVEEDTEAKTKGYIAQDLVDSFPEAYPKGDNGKYMFNPSGMVVYLMKAIQELEAKVAALEAS